MTQEKENSKPERKQSMSKAEKETIIRNEVLDYISNSLSEHYDSDVLRVSGSEITIPWVDSEGNEMWVLVKVSIPRGTRNGNGYDPYDGYEAAEDYKADLEERAAKKAAAEQKKANAIALKAQKAEARQVKKAIKNLEKAVGAE